MISPLWAAMAADWCWGLALGAQAALVVWVGWALYRRKYRNPLHRPLTVASVMGGTAISLALGNLAINAAIFLYLLSQIKYLNAAPFW